MKPGRIVALVIAVLVALPAFAGFIGGAALTVAYATEREDDGFFDATLERLSSPTAAITTEEADLRADPGPPDWVVDALDATVRLQVTSVTDTELFVGIGPSDDVATYLAGVARDEIRDVDNDRDVRFRSVSGADSASPPGDETFWVATVAGAGDQVLEWDLESGEWTAVLMNADGSPGVAADVTVGVRSDVFLTIGIVVLVVGLVVLALAVAVIIWAVRRPPEDVAAAVTAEEPGPVPVRAEPVRLEATLDEPLSQWKWLVKWFLAIPHYIVLFFLWIAFLILTIVAGVVILFTGRYPRGIFDFNVGVLRWSWRVLYYALSGGLGTDRYPPFTTDPVEGYPAELDVAYPERLSRGLVLVKWWLLAIPHYIVVAILAGGWWADAGDGYGGPGLTGVLVLFAAVALLFTARYPRSLFDLIIGLNRWAFRVTAYAALMTDQYPPFRLDQGGREPGAAEEPSG